MHCYVVDISTFNPSEAHYNHLLRIVDQPSRDRINRFHHRSDALRCLVGRLLPGWWVRQKGGGLEGPVDYGRTRYGKAYFNDPSLRRYAFNISHDHNLIILSILDQDQLSSPSAPNDLPSIERVDITKTTTSPSETQLRPESVAGWVGTDIMRLPSNQEEKKVLAEVISDQLHPSEVVFTSSRPSVTELMRIWTIKEAYTKALGIGLALDFKRIAVSIKDLPKHTEAAVDNQMRCDRCEEFVDIEVDGKRVDGGWHVRLGRLHCGDAVGEEEEEEGEAYLWGTVWWQGSNGWGCQVELSHVEVSSLG